MTLRCFVAIILCAMNAFVYGQTTYSTFTFPEDLTQINPAQIGLKGSAIRISFTNQWSGIINSPKNNFLQAELSNEEHPVSLGTYFGMNTSFIQNQVPLFGQFSYRLQLSEKLKLRLGLQAGGVFFQNDFSNLKSVDGVASDSLLESTSFFKPNVGIGFYLSGANYFFSLAIPWLLEGYSLRKAQGVYFSNAFYFLSGFGFSKKLYQHWKIQSALYYYKLYSNFDVLRLQVSVQKKGTELLIGNENRNLLIFGFRFHQKVFSVGYGYTFPMQTMPNFFNQKRHNLSMVFRLTKNE